MLRTAPIVAFLGVRDLAAARAFYEGALDLALAEETDFALVFDAAGATLRVTRVPEVAAAPYTVAGWTVDDGPATVRALAARGVAFAEFDGVEQDTDLIWRAPGGALVAWFRDPDGNLLSLTQLPA